jgi:hypothetical protein
MESVYYNNLDTADKLFVLSGWRRFKKDFDFPLSVLNPIVYIPSKKPYVKCKPVVSLISCYESTIFLKYSSAGLKKFMLKVKG